MTRTIAVLFLLLACESPYTSRTVTDFTFRPLPDLSEASASLVIPEVAGCELGQVSFKFNITHACYCDLVVTAKYRGESVVLADHAGGVEKSPFKKWLATMTFCGLDGGDTMTVTVADKWNRAAGVWEGTEVAVSYWRKQ